jgi:hypothetical protein
MRQLIVLALLLVAVSASLPHGLSAAMIGNAKRQCQQNCAHVPAKGRGLVLRNRCVQQCWNDFFRSMTEAKPHHPAPNGKVMQNVANTKKAILPKAPQQHKNGKAVATKRGRGVPVAGTQLKSMGPVALGILLMVVAGLLL